MARPQTVRRCFQRIAATVESDRGGGSVSRLTLHLNELFLQLLEMWRQKNIALDASLSSSLRTVQLFLDGLAGDAGQLAQEWTVPRMARRCGLGVTHFVHHCRQLTNMTPRLSEPLPAPDGPAAFKGPSAAERDGDRPELRLQLGPVFRHRLPPPLRPLTQGTPA